MTVSLLASSYVLAGAVFLFTAMWVAGDFDRHRRVVLTPRMVGVAAVWPLALAWLVGAAAVDLARAAWAALRRR